MNRNPRFVVRPATDRPGWEVLDTEAAHSKTSGTNVVAARPTESAAQLRADELNQKHAREGA